MAEIKRLLEIVDETILYYSNNLRGLSTQRHLSPTGNGCAYYNSENGAVCAVGRMLKNPELFENNIGSARQLMMTGVLTDSDFKEEYRNLSGQFLNELQIIHDTNHYWDSESPTLHKLTTTGKNKVALLKINITNELYKSED